MAPRGVTVATYGLDHLLDQASAIDLANSPPPSVPPRRHPSPSPDIATWQNFGDVSQDEQMPPPKLPSITRRIPSSPQITTLPPLDQGRGRRQQSSSLGKSSSVGRKSSDLALSKFPLQSRNVDVGLGRASSVGGTVRAGATARKPSVALEQSTHGPTFSKSRRYSYPNPPSSVMAISPKDGDEEATGPGELQRSISLDGGFSRLLHDESDSESKIQGPSEKFLFPLEGSFKSPNEALKSRLVPGSQSMARTSSIGSSSSDKRVEKVVKFRPGHGYETAVVPLPVVRQVSSKVLSPRDGKGSPTETKASKWIAEHEQNLMNSTIKSLGEYLEEEARRALVRMPMAMGEMALVLSQIVSRVEARIDTDCSNFSAANGKAFRDCATTLLDILKREVAARNEKSARARCHQLMNHVLLEAEMLLQDSITNCRRNRQRINVHEIMTEIDEKSLSRFRGCTAGFLSKEASKRLQSDLLQRLAIMADHCAH